MPSSVFTRPRARPPLSSVSSQQNSIDVKTEDELLAALTSLPRSDGACYGRAINIVGDITLTRPVVLASQHSGLTITSSSNSLLSTSTALDSCFNAQNAEAVTIENITLSKNISVTSFAITGLRLAVQRVSVVDGATIVGLVRTLSTVSTGLRILSCVSRSSSAVRLISGASIAIADGVISHNINFTGGIIGVSFSSSVISNNADLGGWTTFSGRETRNCTCTGNTMVGNIEIRAILSLNNVVVGNAMNGFDIDTSTTGGGNTIVGNTNVGTISSAGTDAVTSNT